MLEQEDIQSIPLLEPPRNANLSYDSRILEKGLTEIAGSGFYRATIIPDREGISFTSTEVTKMAYFFNGKIQGAEYSFPQEDVDFLISKISEQIPPESIEHHVFRAEALVKLADVGLHVAASASVVHFQDGEKGLELRYPAFYEELTGSQEAASELAMKFVADSIEISEGESFKEQQRKNIRSEIDDSENFSKAFIGPKPPEESALLEEHIRAITILPTGTYKKFDSSPGQLDDKLDALALKIRELPFYNHQRDVARVKLAAKELGFQTVAAAILSKDQSTGERFVEIAYPKIYEYFYDVDPEYARGFALAMAAAFLKANF